MIMNPISAVEDRRTLIHIERVAELLGIGVGSIRTYVNNSKHHHRIPLPFRIEGRRKLCWYQEDVLAWLEARRAIPLPEYRPRGRPSIEELSRRNYSAGE